MHRADRDLAVLGLSWSLALIMAGWVYREASRPEPAQVLRLDRAQIRDVCLGMYPKPDLNVGSLGPRFWCTQTLSMMSPRFNLALR